MRIGIEAQRLFRKKKHGMEIVALELIRHLQKLDKENQYFIFIKDDIDNQCISETENFRIVIVPGLSYFDWEQIFLPRAIKEYQIDLLHCTCNTAPLRVSVPLVLTLHDIIYLESVNFSGTPYQNFGNLYRRWIVPRVLGNCQKIITVSNFERQCIKRQLSIKNERILVVYNAINSNFRVVKEEKLLNLTRKEYNLPKRFILFFANPSPKKNTLNTLAAYRYYIDNTDNPIPLVLADTNQSYIDELLKRLDMTQFSHLVRVIDFIPFTELPYVYNLASLFLYTSKRESFGLPILEAMACGTPVVTSNTSSMPEISGGAALCADPNSSISIGQQIVSALTSDSLQLDLVNTGIERAKKFTWHDSAKRVLNTYMSFTKN